MNQERLITTEEQGQRCVGEEEEDKKPGRKILVAPAYVDPTDLVHTNEQLQQRALKFGEGAKKNWWRVVKTNLCWGEGAKRIFNLF